MIKVSFILFLVFCLLIIVKSDKETYIPLSNYEIINKFSVRVLKESSIKCGLETNDEAEIEMRTFSPGVSIMPQILSDYQFGYANQKFIVGEHNIDPLNKGLRGMCVGELRLSILIGDMGKIYYEITLKDYKKNVRNTEL
ncbi:conserved Plasmodium protein, unknown function [Plasmodium gallinaceum]|uniref:Peptidylprolyl isomerase n=1 Tax=Plasmodium gallinaceum TaxID=5849 RepID=A0A1J1GY18_PLAGA|nr:conserved Plasmodium protein, unknown function [Plasmodium gallinaceum]CRG97357.1 conserved Plasmodium protein, unknown function [Plasmodium gallinaceum]